MLDAGTGPEENDEALISDVGALDRVGAEMNGALDEEIDSDEGGGATGMAWDFFVIPTELGG